MWFIIGLVVVCVAFYTYIYKNWGFKGKLIFKSILLCLTLLGSILMVILLIWTVGDAFTAEKEKSMANRLSSVEYYASNGKYTYMAFWLNSDMDYEPEFEYLWERLQMYASYNRYVVFSAAKEREELAEEFAEKAEYYKDEFIRLCQNPLCPENKEFGEYYLKQKGFTAD